MIYSFKSNLKETHQNIQWTQTDLLYIIFMFHIFNLNYG